MSEGATGNRWQAQAWSLKKRKSSVRRLLKLMNVEIDAHRDLQPLHPQPCSEHELVDIAEVQLQHVR